MSRRGQLFQSRSRAMRRVSSGTPATPSLYLQAAVIPSIQNADYGSIGIMFDVTGNVQVTSAAIWVNNGGDWTSREMRWQLWEVASPTSYIERANFLFSGATGTLTGAYRVAALPSPYTMVAGKRYVISVNRESGVLAYYYNQDDGGGYTVVSNFGGRITAVGSVYDVSSSGSTPDPASGGTLYKYVRGNFLGVQV